MIRILDFETTGLTADDAVVEAAWVDIIADADSDGRSRVRPDAIQFMAFLINPGRPIPPQASAVHHIVDADVVDAMTWAGFVDALGKLDAPLAYAAHFAKFERQWFNPPDAKWIDTYKVALVMAPNAPSWSNQVLRYWLKLDVDRALAAPPHRAGPDAYVTAHLLVRMLNSGKLTVEEMIEISARPALLPRMTFGEHKDKPWSEVPESYLDWIVNKARDMDEDRVYSARVELKRRRKEKRQW